ncbi:MAG TPA: hypothetical protein VM733_01020 [Thermoanaerobaculia bacterium]|nr:hypothetical protein [Thermoanaerobaculia bacterium]
MTLLALDEASATLAEAVQSRIGIEDLVLARAVSASDLPPVLHAIHARRQSPDSPLRLRDDVSSRELVLLVTSVQSSNVIEIARQVRAQYEMRRFAAVHALEILVLLPELTPPGDYGAAYSLLKMLNADNPADTVWLLDSMNANRVRFGDLSNGAYADAVAGALLYEPELSGAMVGHRPRGFDAAFSSFGYAELVFPRDVALRRLEPRFAEELVREKLLAGAPMPQPHLAAKQFVAAEEFATPLSRIGLEAGESLFMRFRPKTLVTDRTRGADEVIAAVRAELKTFRDGVHLKNLETLVRQGEETAARFAALVARATDETLDRDGYPAAIAFLEASLDPLPDLRNDGARNLVTEIHAASSSLDRRLAFSPNTAASDATRKRIRELDQLLQDQKLVADTLSIDAAEIAVLEGERDELTAKVREIVFAEEGENNAARNGLRDAETARLSAETEAREQQLRELFAQKPRAEESLRDALELRRTFLWQCVIGFVIAAALTWWKRWFGAALTAGALWALFRYLTLIAPAVRMARETLQSLVEHIDVADKSKNSAHNDELQFEYDVAHRRTTLSVLGRTREAAKATLDAVRSRFAELQALSFERASIAPRELVVNVIDDADVDAWYERTADDRKPLLRDFPISRSRSRHLSADDLRRDLDAYAATAFDAFRHFTIGQGAALANESDLARRLKRFVDTAAPLIDLRSDDLPAQQAMQRDTTLWIDNDDARFAALLHRRIPDAHVRPAADPLRVHAVSRVLHYPAYVLGQIDYYRSQYDPAQHPQSANAPDLIPLTAAVRDAYEQVLLGLAVGVIRLREDGQLVSNDVALGNTHLAAAEHLAGAAALRRELETALEPRLRITADLDHDLQQVATSAFDREVASAIAARYRL